MTLIFLFVTFHTVLYSITAKLVPVGYGIKKLQISCVVEDDKVCIIYLHLVCRFSQKVLYTFTVFSQEAWFGLFIPAVIDPTLEYSIMDTYMLSHLCIGDIKFCQKQPLPQFIPCCWYLLLLVGYVVYMLNLCSAAVNYRKALPPSYGQAALHSASLYTH